MVSKYNPYSLSQGVDDEGDPEDYIDDSGNVRDMGESAPGPGHNSEDIDLSGLELNDLMLESRRLLFEDLFRAVKAGYASPAEKATLAKLLKDNGIVAGDPFGGAEGGPNGGPADLPSFGRPDYEQE